MKKILAIFVVFGAIMQSEAQTINDVVRYGTEDLQGTARYRSMSGAFGALGGDLSALNNNPAGSAVFNNGSFTFSGTSYNTKNKTNYFGGNTSTDVSNFDLNQLGGVLVFNNTGSRSGWNKFSLAFNFEKANNFENEFVAAGNSDRSIDEYFLYYAQGIPKGDLLVFEGENIEDAYLDIGSAYGFQTQQAFLGFQAYLIEPVEDTDDNTEYVPNTRYNNTVNQQIFQSTSGYNNKFTLNMAGQFLDDFYVGASLNFHDIQYEKYTELKEDGYNSESVIGRTKFDNLQLTSGTAFSFSLGGIARVGEMLRVGATYQSPTWYKLNDELSQRISTDYALDVTPDIEFINFSLVNIYPDYKIQIPAKYTGSLALIFGQEGLLSFDYSYQDMSNAKLKPTSDPDFADENDYIGNTLKAVSTFRLGGEYRIERFSLRGGYRFEESPYDSDMIGDLNGYSLGLGYDFGMARIDAAFSQYMRDYHSQFYDRGFTNTAAIDSKNTNVTLSLTLNL
ncbi:OmpP1/FadL family transporter [Sinomicrobium weinanense]|uniref:Outer membrane protein transport protein n=1 Tax=Sinomicrobium weinanense TaxID=2842200 RepID=A0A926Q346_9FLAO|nr:outer membrane protein transport protein [Sinomicrobium weinanense]MBC9796524.1 outer membrane protein transport protein [Sinomicrobium weinanense]MBU3123540.1 outer membrane protein transport protein [Sinomicrobium weinanense]